MNDGISQKVSMEFESESIGTKLLVHGQSNGRRIGRFEIDRTDPKIVHGRFEIFPQYRGRGYARSFIEHIIGILSEMRVVHCLYLTTDEAEAKLRHIYLEHGYEEVAPTFLLRDYSQA